MESRIYRIKCFENNCNGYSFMGPHDPLIDSYLGFRNGTKGFGIGLVTANSAIAYITNSHTWGSPQQVGFEDHTASHWINCSGEMTSASGFRAWAVYSSGTVISGSHALWAGSGGGNVGLEIQNNAPGCMIDMMFSGGFGNGAVLLTSTGGANRIPDVANSLAPTRRVRHADRERHYRHRTQFLHHYHSVPQRQQRHRSRTDRSRLCRLPVRPGRVRLIHRSRLRVGTDDPRHSGRLAHRHRDRRHRRHRRIRIDRRPAPRRPVRLKWQPTCRRR